MHGDRRRLIVAEQKPQSPVAERRRRGEIGRGRREHHRHADPEAVDHHLPDRVGSEGREQHHADVETAWLSFVFLIRADAGFGRSELQRFLEGRGIAITRNLIGNGATERRDDGISDFGVAIIERMNKVGMAVDVSHCGDRTTLDAFEVSKKPVLITHSNCRALAPGHPRCKTDEAIRKMAASGGVMGITSVRMFVKNDEPTTIEHFLDHFDHVKKLVGVEHLGVGSDIDLDGYDDMPAEENRRLRAGYKGSYGFREKIDIEGIDHPKRMLDRTGGFNRRQ